MAIPETTISYGLSNPVQIGPARSAIGDLAELDTLALDYLIPCAEFAQWRVDALAAGLVRGGAFPEWEGMYIQALAAEQEGGTHAMVSATGFGLLSAGEKRRRAIACAGQVIAVGPIEEVIVVWDEGETAEDPSDSSSTDGKRRIPKLDAYGEVVYKTIITPTGSAARWNINQAVLTVSDTYFATSAPATSASGTAVTPPSAPTPPAYLWGGYLEPMRANHPNGWVLDNRQIDDVVPGFLWRVTDNFAYYHTQQPD